MRAHLQIVVSLEAEDEEFVEWNLSKSLARSDAMLYLVVVALGLR